MNIQQFEQKHNVRLLLKSKSTAMKVASWFLGKGFLNNFWTTYRLPFQKQSTITFTDSNDISKYSTIPDWAIQILNHELVHVDQQKGWWRLLKVALYVSIFPFPILFSGRWFLERPAYLVDIKDGRYTVDDAVETLWSDYVWCWPKSLMKKWFEEQLKLDKNRR